MLVPIERGAVVTNLGPPLSTAFFYTRWTQVRLDRIPRLHPLWSHLVCLGSWPSPSQLDDAAANWLYSPPRSWWGVVRGNEGNSEGGDQPPHLFIARGWFAQSEPKVLFLYFYVLAPPTDVHRPRLWSTQLPVAHVWSTQQADALYSQPRKAAPR